MTFYHVIAIARDWSVLVLAVPILVLLAVQVFVLWHVTRGLRAFSPKVRPAIRSAQQVVVRAAGSVDAARVKVESPFVRAQTLPVQMRATVQALFGGRHARR